jgi:hypothetical protein
MPISSNANSPKALNYFEESGAISFKKETILVVEQL